MALGTSQRVWPALAVRAALRLFGTPLPPKWLNRRHAWSAPWQIERRRFEQAGLTVYSMPQASGPVALLVHGWGGHAAQLLPLAESLAQQGLSPVLVEMPAHGRSPGATSNGAQFARAMDYVTAHLQQQGHTVRVAVAHSLGGNALAYAASRGLAAEKLVLIAPAASPREFTHLFAHVFGLAERTRAAMQELFESREGVLLPQFEPAATGPRIRVPTLVVHDRGDGVNPFADGQAFAHAIRGAELLATEGLGHRKLLKDAGVIGRIALFAR
jgi:pimeloyl-ACP methyl ester carboxylesterase